MKLKGTLILFFAITFLMGSVVGYLLKDPVQELLISKTEQVQPQDSPENRVRAEQRMRNYMVRELSLEEDQVEAFFAVMQQRRRSMREIMDSSRTETNQLIRIQADSLNMELREILTVEQFEKWDKIQERYRRSRGQRGGQGRD